MHVECHTETIFNKKSTSSHQNMAFEKTNISFLEKCTPLSRMFSWQYSIVNNHYIDIGNCEKLCEVQKTLSSEILKFDLYLVDFIYF